MGKTIAFDLGTHSIGWAIRDDEKAEKQIIDAGVLTFEKGVAEIKGIETPKVTKRTESRGKRRNYQARKYRKQFLLKLLIENSMCPLSTEQLNLWTKYDGGRQYPQQPEFFSWLKLDFDGDGKADYLNPYQLRAAVVEGKETNPYAIGRALYHLIQRRGFSGGKGENPDEVKLIDNGSPDKGTRGRNDIKDELASKTLGQVYSTINSHAERIRNRYNLRSDVKNELDEICRQCGFTEELNRNLIKAIIWQRPLRGQKGNVGKCTLERSKPRCLVSHPLFELFRAWNVINNIKVKAKGVSPKEFRRLSEQQRWQVYSEIFMRKSPHFTFIDIAQKLDKRGELDFNYHSDDSISGCPVSARLLSIFGDNWRDTQIGKTMDGEGKAYYDIEDIWHVAATFDKEEKIKEFAITKLGLNEDQTKEYIKLWEKMPTGYGNLSLSAIRKILPHLINGEGYPEAVMLANLDVVIGTDFPVEKAAEIKEKMLAAIEDYDYIKNVNNVINALIADHLALPPSERFGYDEKYAFDDNDKAQIEAAIVSAYGEGTWASLTEPERQDVRSNVSAGYLSYLHAPVNSKKFVRTERRSQNVKRMLKEEYAISNKKLDRLYHHSDKDIYPKVNDSDDGRKYLQSPVPPANGFKNPMAIKTLYKLRYLVNYLIGTGKIDDDTKVIVEVPRELTTSNKRKAWEKWQKDRAQENIEFAKAISELNKDAHLSLNPVDPENTDKFRLWFDQLEARDEAYKAIQVLKSDIDKYRLWKEQECRCLYTGKTINIAELFSDKYDFEHTIPLSMSFDNSLSNKTVCDKTYNRQVKGKEIPYNLPNYKIDVPNKYTSIKPRLKAWEDKVDSLRKKIAGRIIGAKQASNKEQKDSAIQSRHYYEFELEYWQRKLNAFTIKEYKAAWKNSQLVDTGIVSKYAFHYLKTVFDKVYVQKGEVTAIFRKIYEVQNAWEAKSRDKHAHHAMDAAVLTFVPTGYTREKLLERYFRAAENKERYHEKPYPNFHQTEIKDIEDRVLINYLPEDRALEQAKRYVRVRGKKKLYKNVKGEDVLRIATGNTIRGQLHKESFYGAIKLGVFENGKLLRDKQGKVKQEEGVRYVIRKDLKYGETGFTDKKQLEKIVDPVVRKRVLDHVGNRSIKEAFAETVWMNEKKGIKIRRVRVEVDRLSEPLLVKKHETAFLSKKEHKQYYYSENGGGANFRYVIYSDKEVFKPEVKVFRLIEAAEEMQAYRKFEIPQTLTIKKRGKESQIPLYAIIKVGSKVLIYDQSPEELYEMTNSELSKRLYRVFKFRADDYRISLQHHLEARKDDELGGGSSKADFNDPAPRLLLSKSNLNLLIEGKHFKVMPDGSLLFNRNQ